MVGRRKRQRVKVSNRLFQWLVLLVSIVLLLLIFINRDSFAEFSKLGYLGIFLINFISSATVFLPAPGTASVFIGGAVWNPFWVGIVSGLGSAIGELLGYILGYGGRGILVPYKLKGGWIKNLEKNFHKRGFLTTFIFSILPIPIFDVIGVIAGAVNFPVGKFFLAAGLGRMLRNVIFALTGAKFLPD